MLVFIHSGQFSSELENLSDEKQVALAMNLLKQIYGPDIPEPTFYLCTRWYQNPYSYGSYSFFSVGSSPYVFEDARKSVQNRLFFAGEHTTLSYLGCAHGAYDTGLKAASEAQQSLLNSKL